MTLPYATPNGDDMSRTMRVDLSNKPAEFTLPIHPDHAGATHPRDRIVYL